LTNLPTHHPGLTEPPHLAPRAALCQNATMAFDDQALPAEAVSIGYVGASQTMPNVPQTYENQNQLILASYPNGRGGALRPLQRQEPASLGGFDEGSVASDLSLTSSAARRVERPAKGRKRPSSRNGQ